MEPTNATTRVLLVTDWNVDPHAVVAAASRRAERSPAIFGLLVPAWLHGLGWAGDPNASRPCAQRQVEAVNALLDAAGLHLEHSAVGDPDPATAICDELDAWPANEVLLCTGPRHFPSTPLDVVHRARRLTGLPVERKFVPRSVANAGT